MPTRTRDHLTPGSVRDQLDELRATVTWLEQRQEGLATDVRDAIQHISYTLSQVQVGVLDHVTGDARANAARDALLCEHAASLAQVAGKAGGKSGAVAGAIVAGVLTAAAPAIAKIIQGCLGP